MDERCKHDLLPGQCGLCQVVPPAPADHSDGQELVAWLERFVRAPESGVPAQRTDHESPQPGASAGSRPTPAIPLGGSESSPPAAPGTGTPRSGLGALTA